MRPTRSLAASLLLALLLAPATAFAERIDSFDVDISIAPDSSIEVIESIAYDFEDAERHGIYRYIPTRYTGRGQSIYRLRPTLHSITDESGEPFTYADKSTSREVRWRIGDPDIYVTGKQTYQIAYSVDRALRFFDTHTELYWNVTGDEWLVPIDNASVTITAPADILDVACFTGEYGSAQEDCQTTIDGSTATVSTTDLFLLQGMTFALKLAPDAITPPSIFRQLNWFFLDNYGYLLPILTLLVMLYLILRYGRDPRLDRSITPLYQPPLGKNKRPLSPAEVGTIIDERLDMRDIAAMMIDLAARGYLRIDEIKPRRKNAKVTNWLFTRLSKKTTSLKDFEKKLLDKIFHSKKTTKLSSLKNSFYRHLPDLQKLVYESLVANGYFQSNPAGVRDLYYGIGSTIAFIGLGSFFFLTNFNLSLPIGIIISGLIILALAHLMPVRTLAGVRARYDILGLQEFILRAKGAQLRWMESKGTEAFESLLPYALALGIAEQWGERFEQLKFNPDWYQGQGSLNSLLLANSLSSFSAHTGSALSSQPRASSSSSYSSGSSFSSGFSGGGFSGGGFGGGGGGSW